MPTKIPIRTVYDAQNVPVGLAEFQPGETIDISVGGTGGNTVATARVALSVDDSNIRKLFSVTGSGSYNNTTGVITVTGDVVSVGGATGTVSNVQLGSSIIQSGILTTANVVELTNLYYTDARVFAAVTGNLSLKANLSSPALTGTPTAPTANAGTNSTQIATTEYVATAVSNLIDSAPGALDTLNELAAAINDDNNFASTVVTQLGTKANITSKLSVFSSTTSAELAGVISDETGTGLLVFNASPTFTGNVSVQELSASGNVTSPFFYSQSDINLKKDVKPLENSLSTIMSLEGMSFNWKHNNQPAIGLIAQQVEALIPFAVGQTPDGYKTVQYNSIIAILVEAIKEQQNQINSLKQQVEKLNG